MLVASVTAALLPALITAAHFPSSFRSLNGRAIFDPINDTDSRILWPKGEIPYVLQDLPRDLSEHIRQDMRNWEQRSCVRFIPKTDNNIKNFVSFRKRDRNCFSEWRGMMGGEQIVNLDYPNFFEVFGVVNTGVKCNVNGAAGRALGRVLGLDFEHLHPQRSKYIRVLWDNIIENQLDSFVLKDKSEAPFAFDYNSIMMFDSKELAKPTWKQQIAGSKSLKHTLRTITDWPIRPAKIPISTDFKAINLLYSCEDFHDREVPECNRAPIGHPDYSSYKFLVDKHTEDWMHSNNYTHVGVHQHCSGNWINMDTDNWSTTPLNGSGPNSWHTVTTDRCKKDHSRHVSQWEMVLCKNDNRDSCDIKCGYRRICPIDSAKQGVFSKSVDLVDEAIWVCHPH